MLHLFHKWKYVYRRAGTFDFEGVELPRFERAYRICTKCGKAQEIVVSFAGEWWWETLDRIRKRILMRLVVDKGDHYYLRSSNRKPSPVRKE